MFHVEVLHLQDVQSALRRAQAAVRPSNGLGAAVQYATLEAQRYAIGRTHVVTGTLRASHRAEVSGTRGRVYIEPSAVNPVTRQLPSRYGVFEHARGGDHAFYENTVVQDGPRIVRAAADVMRRWLP